MIGRLFCIVRQAVFPSRCLACGRLFHPDNDSLPEANPPEDLVAQSRARIPLEDPGEIPLEILFRQGLGPFFCPDCRQEFTPVASPFCSRCGRMFTAREGDNHLCGACIHHPPACRAIRAAGVYSGALKAAIHGLKYHHRVHLARPLGELLYHAFWRFYHDQEIDAVMPVPLHPSRLRQRGFNQALMLIHQWPAQWPALFSRSGHPRGLVIDDNHLARRRKTRSQTGLGREKRRQNVRGAFAVSNTETLQGKHILLVDDVYTTGSTMEECARSLLAAGAGGVSALTLARAA